MGAILGLLVFAYQLLTISLISPYSFNTMCHICRESNMRGESCWGCWCLLTISLLFPQYILTNSLPCASCAEMSTISEGSHFGVAGVCIPLAHHISYWRHMARIQKGRFITWWGWASWAVPYNRQVKTVDERLIKKPYEFDRSIFLEKFGVADHLLTVALLSPYCFLTKCYMCRNGNNM